MAPRVPNFNTFSSLLDRLAIENVKLAHFENALEHDKLADEQTASYRRKAEVQRVTIEVLKAELADLMEEAFRTGGYEFISEERTFT